MTQRKNFIPKGCYPRGFDFKTDGVLVWLGCRDMRQGPSDYYREGEWWVRTDVRSSGSNYPSVFVKGAKSVYINGGIFTPGKGCSPKDRGHVGLTLLPAAVTKCTFEGAPYSEIRCRK